MTEAIELEFMREADLYYTEDYKSSIKPVQIEFEYNIEEAVEKGLNKAEIEYQETAKQYVEDIDYEEILQIYNKYDNGKPPMILNKLTLDTPVGTYILKD